MRALRRHNTETHSNNPLGVFIPQPCSHKDCSSDEIARSTRTRMLAGYITRRHGKITGANLQSLIVRRQPDGTAKAPPPPLTQQKSNPFEDKTTKYNPSPCLVDGCTAKGEEHRFRDWESYKRHLLSKKKPGHAYDLVDDHDVLLERFRKTRVPSDAVVRAPPLPVTHKSSPFEDKTTKFIPSPCLVDGCTAKGEEHRFRDWESYKRHLLSKKKPGHAYDPVDDHDVLLEHFHKTRIPK
ncbi:unnamed protein product [Zymoseptoria tritici ST99CH_1A5]|uniref:Uncharacterized protein n=1 Tax=Zymoseptoria tritici ST99CH_1A5 TaxID=1276529 RepID=A0A1Y6LAH1_ZYMTR|nr:unnamed protein product [Zymoseptoria tritici ST99CH_1A5]